MFGNDRTAMRRFFTEAWRKRVAREPLEPLERLVSEAIGQHPEYHPLIEAPELALEQEFLPESGQTNPFLHLGMHIGLQEQVTTDRPAGIAALYRRLVIQSDDIHKTEHRMMECLGRMLWDAQRTGQMPDETGYLECVRSLLRG
jgi:hypothetical protein